MDYTNFRSAIGGFRRSDVFAYIERTSQEHRQKLRELEKANAALRAENDELQAKLAQTTATAPVVEEAPEDLDARELAAYRRAEAAERNARRRVAKLGEQVTALTEASAASLSDMDAEAQAIAASLQALTEKTNAMLAELKQNIASLSATLDSESSDDE